MVTRVIAVQNLAQSIGQGLGPWAAKIGIPTFSNGKQNKAWKGQTIEQLAGLTGGNAQAPNGLGIDLKSTTGPQRNGSWIPKKTMAITIINARGFVDTPFFKSHCWEKLKSILFCAVSGPGQHSPKSRLLSVQSFDFLEDNRLIRKWWRTINSLEQSLSLLKERLPNEPAKMANGYKQVQKVPRMAR